MNTEPKPDAMIDLLDASMKVVEAALDYEAILLKPRAEVREREFKAILKRLFSHAHLVNDMRLKNLQDALNEIGESDDFKNFLRRN